MPTVNLEPNQCYNGWRSISQDADFDANSLDFDKPTGYYSSNGEKAVFFDKNDRITIWKKDPTCPQTTLEYIQNFVKDNKTILTFASGIVAVGCFYKAYQNLRTIGATPPSTTREKAKQVVAPILWAICGTASIATAWYANK